MRILLTNDDGIEAPGLRALFEAVRGLGEIAISAPDQQASATGHSISLNSPFKVTTVDWPGVSHAFRVESTPADCVRTAVLKLLPWKPDLVISGINQGANYGSLILYSGTVAAAAEAVLLGVPAVAVSLASHTFKDFSTAAEFAGEMAAWISEKGLSPGLMLNVNLPPLGKNEIKGVSLTQQGLFRHIEDLEEHEAKPGHFSYILNSPSAPLEEHSESDVFKVKNGFISVTPLHLDLTARHAFEQFAEWPWKKTSWKS